MKTRKLLSVILTVALALTLIPGLSLTVYAEPAFTVSGSVRCDGAIVPAALVTVSDGNGNTYGPAETDADGLYSIAGIPAGTNYRAYADFPASYEVDGGYSDFFDIVDIDVNAEIDYVTPEPPADGGSDPEVPTYSLTASQDTVSSGESVIFTTDAPEDNMAAFFLDGEYWGNGSIGSTPNPFPWDIIGSGNTEDVVATYRIYDYSADGDDPTWETPFLAEVNVTFMLDPEAVDPGSSTSEFQEGNLDTTLFAGDPGDWIIYPDTCVWTDEGGTFDTFDEDGTYWDVYPSDELMTVLQPYDYAEYDFQDGMPALADALGLSDTSTEYIEDVFGVYHDNEGYEIGNSAYIYQDLYLTEGTTFSVYWNFVGTDYDEYNDGSLASLVYLDGDETNSVINGNESEVEILGAILQGTGNYTTGSYGSTGWQTATFEVTADGNYRIGFAAFNIGDFEWSPYLIIDNVQGETYKDGGEDPFEPVDPDPVFGSDYTLTASQDTVSIGESVVFTTDAPEDNMAAFFLDGEYWGSGSVGTTPNPFPWEIIGDGNTEDVVATYRIYDYSSDGENPDWDTPYLAQVHVTFTLDPNAEEEPEDLTSNAKLSGLTFDQLTLSPEFESETESYTSSVGSGVTSISATPTLAGPSAEITEITLNGSILEDWTSGQSLPLITGTNILTIKVTAEDGVTTKIYTITITKASASHGSNGTTNPVSQGTPVYVNGEQEDAGETTTKTEDGKTITTVTIDEKKLETILSEKGDNATVLIPITQSSDMQEGVLNGQMVKDMEAKEATLVIQTATATYTLPAAEIKIDDISRQIGQEVNLSDIKVTVGISEPSPEMTKVIESSEESGSFTLVVPAVEFTISCEYNGTQVDVSHFNSYIERTIAIPDGVDPQKITTGIVIEQDGTVRHVPTKITVIDGKYYAVINSLTNSIYSVIWNPVTFKDVENHWAMETINNMGSRMVVTGVDSENYLPDQEITRAEFAAIIVRALGLQTESEESGFLDVDSADWFNGYIKTASEYGLIKGYSTDLFGADGKITREEAMVIIARAMDLAGLDHEVTASEQGAVLTGYHDSAAVSSYAKAGVEACLAEGVVNGRSGSSIAPKDYITRAEVAVIVERMLQKAKLI